MGKLFSRPMKLAETRDLMIYLRALLHQVPGVELQTLNMLIAISLAPRQTLRCSFHELSQICRMSDENSRRLANHLVSVGWIKIQIDAAGQTELHLTSLGLNLLQKLLDLIGKFSKQRPGAN